MPRALLLDFNGVLVDDERIHFETLRDALAEAGVRIEEAEYWSGYLALDDRAAAAEALARAGRPREEGAAETVAARKAALYADRTADGVPYFDGAVETVRALAERYPLGLVSGAIRREIEAALQAAGIRDLFRAVVAAEDTTASKPAPSGYLVALERLEAAGVSAAAQRCVAVEDSPGGIEAARRAGLKVVAVAQTVSADKLIGADLILPRFADLTPIHLERLVP